MHARPRAAARFFHALALMAVIGTVYGMGNGMLTIVKGTAIAQYVSRAHVATLNGALGLPPAAGAGWAGAVCEGPAGVSAACSWAVGALLSVPSLPPLHPASSNKGAENSQRVIIRSPARRQRPAGAPTGNAR